MGISDTFKKLVGIEEVEDDFDDEELEAEKERISRESVRKPQTEYKAPKAMGDIPRPYPSTDVFRWREPALSSWWS